jgi:hypothetical protein
MNRYIDSFAKVEYDADDPQLTPKMDEYGNWYFVTDGDFKIMQITDVHIGGGVLSREEDMKAMNAIAAMVAYEKPDLVVSTGDMAATYPHSGSLNNEYSHEYFARLMENLGVYWTVNFGNHDSEIYNFEDREDVADIYEDDDYRYCLFSEGPKDVSGYGNHVINVRNSQGLVTQSIIMMDTHAYTDKDPLGLMWDYDYVKEDQIGWYIGVVDTYSAYNKSLLSAMDEAEKPANAEDFETVKSLIFIHIPLVEVHDAYREYVNNGRPSKGRISINSLLLRTDYMTIDEIRQTKNNSVKERVITPLFRNLFMMTEIFEFRFFDKKGNELKAVKVQQLTYEELIKIVIHYELRD